MRRGALIALLVLHAGSVRLAAQDVRNAALRDALRAYEELDFPQAIVSARQALDQRLETRERARAYEVLGFAYAATDSQVQAVDAFRELILLDPDRELNPTRISRKITSLFASALAQVVVVRHLRVDSTRFVGGDGYIPIRFTVSSPARVRTAAVSGTTSMLIDSSMISGTVIVRWPAQLPDGNPVPPGEYLVVIEATEGRNTFSRARRIQIAHDPVDTLPHLTSLPGYDPLPETAVAPRDWRPLGLAFLYAGVAGAATLALERGDLGSGPRREFLIISGGALVTGVVMTIREPAPRAVPGNVLYNRMLGEQLARRNAEIAEQNRVRRRQVLVTVTPLPPGETRR